MSISEATQSPKQADSSSITTSFLAGYDPDSWTFDFFEELSGRWVGWLSSDEIGALGESRTPKAVIEASCKEAREENMTLAKYCSIFGADRIVNLAELC